MLKNIPVNNVNTVPLEMSQNCLTTSHVYQETQCNECFIPGHCHSVARCSPVTHWHCRNETLHGMQCSCPMPSTAHQVTSATRHLNCAVQTQYIINQ